MGAPGSIWGSGSALLDEGGGCAVKGMAIFIS